MRRSIELWSLTVTAFLAAGALALADEKDEKIPLEKVPAAVTAAVKAKYPKAELVSAELGDQDGKKVYEIALKSGVKKWEASFTPEGKFVSSEESVAAADLPTKVKEAFDAKYPKAKVVSMEKETTGEGDGAKVVYEIVIETDKGKIEVQFSPDGKLIAEEKVK